MAHVAAIRYGDEIAAVSSSGIVCIIREENFARERMPYSTHECDKLSPDDIARRRLPTIDTFHLSQRAAQHGLMQMPGS